MFAWLAIMITAMILLRKNKANFLSFIIPWFVGFVEEVDMAYNNAIKNGATSVLEPELEPWGQRTCYIADPEGNLIEIGSWNKVYEQKDL